MYARCKDVVQHGAQSVHMWHQKGSISSFNYFCSLKREYIKPIVSFNPANVGDVNARESIDRVDQVHCIFFYMISSIRSDGL